MLPMLKCPLNHGLSSATGSILLLLVVGCSAHQNDAAQPSQVVVSVSGRELTISQVNRALSELRNIGDPAKAQASVIDGMINEELMVQAANSAHLDRDPDVMLSLEAARRKVLARAYADKQLFSSYAEIGNAELQAFYEHNPQLFSKRRVYRAVLFAPESPLSSDALQEIKQARSEPEIRSVFSRFQVKTSSQYVERAAEEWPLNVLPNLLSAEAGQVLVYEAVGQTEFILLLSYQDAPLTFEQSRSKITNVLLQQRNQERLQEFLQNQRATANIHYAPGYGPDAQRSQRSTVN